MLAMTMHESNSYNQAKHSDQAPSLQYSLNEVADPPDDN